MKGGGNRALKVVGGLGVSAVFIWLTLRNKPLAEIWAALTAAKYLYLVPYVLCVLVPIHFIRVVRWGILLEPVGKPTFKKLNAAGAMGFMALVVLPFRLGEFARPFLIAEKGKLRKSAAMASVVVERVIDGLAMAMVLMVALLFAKPADTNGNAIYWARMSGLGVFAFFMAILVFLVVAWVKHDLAVRVIERVTSPVSKRLAAKLSEMLDAFITALKKVPSRKKIAYFFILTVVYWGLNGLGMSLLAMGFGLDLGIVPAFAVLGVLVAGVMIPAGPGMVGPFQAAVEIGMKLFFPTSTMEATIVAYSWVLWAAQMGQQVAFGVYFLLKGHVAFGSLWGGGGGDEEDEPTSPPAAPQGKADGG